MRYIVYHQPIPHTLHVAPSKREYAFVVKNAISLAAVENEDADWILHQKQGCPGCGGVRKVIYREASPAQVRRWNGASRPEHFDPEYEAPPEEVATFTQEELYGLAPWPRLSVVVPVWNRAELTWQFIQQFAQYGNLGNAELIIVDNGSTDRTSRAVERWRSAFPKEIQSLTLDTNHGVSNGYNKGAELARSQLLLFMNNDVTLGGDIVTPFVTAMLSSPKPALFGAHLISHDGHWNCFDKKIISYLEGWCVGCSTELFEELGGFDTRYTPCDYEDVDLSWTATQKGYELRWVRVPASHHQRGASAKQLHDRYAITERNREQFQRKWNL